MTKKRIVKILSQSFLPIQGRYPRIHGEAVTLAKAGCEVLIVGWDRTGQCLAKEIVNGLNVQRIRVRTSDMLGPYQLPFLALFWLKVLIALLPMTIDVIHCHNLDVLPLGYILGKLKRCPVIFDAHEPEYYALWPEKWHRLLKFINYVEVFLARRVDYVIITNHYQLKKFQVVGIKKVMIIGNYPVDSFIIEEIPREKYRKNEVVFGRIGTIYHDVGIEEAVIAFSRIMKKYPDAMLLLAGRVVDTYYDELMELVKPPGSRLTLHGAYNADEMPQLYAETDASLMIYRKTRWFRHITPTKFYDSLAHGVPVIMTDIGGLGDIIERYNCGIVVDENDIPGISEAMETMIRDNELRMKMAENGLKLIKEEFNWKKMEERLLGIYNYLMR